MRTVNHIPANFDIQSEYREIYIFQGNAFSIIIAPSGTRELMVIHRGNPKAWDAEQSRAMDWIHETIERIRFDNEG